VPSFQKQTKRQGTEDILLHLNGQTIWFPKSHIKLPKKLHGKEISINVQNWVYDSNIRFDEDVR